MKLLITCPFRTNINLNSINGYANLLQMSKQLQSAIKKCDFSEDVKITDIIHPKAQNGTYYASLSEDNLSTTASPLFVIHGTSSFIEKFRRKFLFETSLVINSCNIEAYDNTIGILMVDFSIKDHSFLSQASPEKAETLLTSLCQEIIHSLLPDLKRVEKALIDKKIKPNFFLSPGNFQIFSDLNKSSNLPTNDYSLMWATRILIPSQHPSPQTIQKWTQQTLSENNILQIEEAKIFICTGNNLIVGKITKPNLESLKKTLSICTYFYTIYELINQNLKLTFIKLHTQTKSTPKDLTDINQVSTYIDFIENEIFETNVGLQGFRNKLAESFMRQWKYDSLVKSVKQKKLSITQKIEHIRNKQKHSYSKIVETILAAIGGLTLFDLSLSLISFSNNQDIPQDPIFGITDIALFAPADTSLYITLFIFLCIIVIVSFKR